MGIWDHAIKRKDPKTKKLEGQCKRCNRIIQCSKNSTTTLKNHLISHGIVIDDDDDEEDDRPVQKQPRTMWEFVKKQSLKEIVSDLATDGISIHAITNNAFIRKSIQREGYKLPSNESDVMKLIVEDYEEKKALMVKEIKNKLINGCKFSITVDEYTSKRSRRYFGINIHDSLEKKTFKTGIVRIFGTCPAELMVQSIKKHLADFGIGEQDIVGTTQDGAAVNKKYVRIWDIIGQYCLNHGIHLAVIDTLYKKQQQTNDLYDLDSEDMDETDYYDEAFGTEDFEEPFIDDIDFHQLLKKSREIVKFIKNSTVRNHVFQSKVKALYGKEKELQLDVQHRWNSLASMIEPLIATKTALFETFNELNAIDMINMLDFGALEELLDAMKPINAAVTVLSRQDSTLLTANTVINFTYQKLTKMNTDISRDLMSNLKKRISERWNEDVMNLIISLDDPTKVPSKKTIDFAGKLGQKLFGFCDESSEETEGCNLQNDSEDPPTLIEEIDLLLQKNKNQNPPNTCDKFKFIKQEFTVLKNTGNRTDNLQKLYDALLSIKPTSTDVERIFSTCNVFCTKLRTRLADKSLNALVFLKFYYKSKK